MKLLVWLVLVAAAATVRSDYIDRLLSMAQDDTARTGKLLNALSMNDLEKGTDDQVFANDDEPRIEDMVEIYDDGEEGAEERAFGVKSIMSYGTKALKATKKGLKNKLKAMVSKFKKELNKASQKGLEGWKKFKTALKNPKKSGKKLLKSVLKDVYETGKEEALEYLKAALLEWVDKTIEDTLCECFYNKKKGDENLTEREKKRLAKKRKVRRCRCCIRPPGFKKSCLKIIAKLKSKSFDVSITFNNTEFLKTDLVLPKEEKLRSICSVPKVAEPRRDVCAPMPTVFHFISVCISPGNVEIDRDDESEDPTGFGACFQVRIGKLSLSFEKCVQYDYDEKQISFVKPDSDESYDDEE